MLYLTYTHLCIKKVREKSRSATITKVVREQSREFHNHKPQPFPDIKRKRKPTNPNKHKSIKRLKSTKISSLFPKRGNRNAKRTEKHKNKMALGKTYNKRREKSRECHNHKPQPFPDPKRKRKPTNLNKHKPNKRTKIIRKSPRRINHKAPKSKTNIGTSALERSVE